jgi:hypothetical protein
MISISADTKKLEFALAKLAEAAKVDLGLVIKQEAAYVAKAIMQITPPTGDKTKKGATVATVTGGTITKTKASGLSRERDSWRLVWGAKHGEGILDRIVSAHREFDGSPAARRAERDNGC